MLDTPFWRTMYVFRVLRVNKNGEFSPIHFVWHILSFYVKFRRKFSDLVTFRIFIQDINLQTQLYFFEKLKNKTFFLKFEGP